MTTEKSQAVSKDDAARTATGATPVVAAEELDPGRERRPLESYFQEIGGTRTLKREEEVILAKDLEAATARLRDSLYAIPVCAKHVVARWDALRALSHTGAKLSESAGDEETGEIAARVELPVATKQALLECDSEAIRLETLRETLDALVEGAERSRQVAERAAGNGHAPI